MAGGQKVNAPLSFGVNLTVPAYRIVAPGTSGSEYKAIYPASAAVIPMGVSLDTVKDTGGSLPVAGPGNIAKVLFNDTCTTGTLVASDSSGRGIPIGTLATGGSAYVGYLVGPSVSSTGTIADVLIMPGIAYEIP
jgi:hypothetical protein